MFIVPFLLVAFALLYFFPDDTRHWFAWDVQPTITPLIMGAGYIAGAYFFVRVARERRWHRIQVGFLPVTAFTVFMAIGDLQSPRIASTRSTSRSGSGSGLYVITPVLVPLAWWRNRATDPGTPEPGRAAAATARAHGAARRSARCSRWSRWCCCCRRRR